MGVITLSEYDAGVKNTTAGRSWACAVQHRQKQNGEQQSSSAGTC